MGEVFEFDSADAENGKRGVAVDFGDVGGADGRVVGLGRSRKKRTEADVVRLLLKGGSGLRGAVGGEADEFARADEAAGFGDGLVVLPDMNAVGARGSDEFGMVVEEEGNSSRAAERSEVLGDGEDLLGGEFFGAELEDLDSASEHGAGGFDRLRRLDIAEVENAVEVAG